MDNPPAVVERHLEVVRLLFEYGADVFWANEAGQTSSLAEEGSAMFNLLVEEAEERERLTVRPLLK